MYQVGPRTSDAGSYRSPYVANNISITTVGVNRAIGTSEVAARIGNRCGLSPHLSAVKVSNSRVVVAERASSEQLDTRELHNSRNRKLVLRFIYLCQGA